MLNIISYSLIAVIMLLTFLCVSKMNDFFSRIVCFNSISNVVALFIAHISTYKENDLYLDIAVIYVLLSYIVTIALLRFHPKSVA